MTYQLVRMRVYPYRTLGSIPVTNIVVMRTIEPVHFHIQYVRPCFYFPSYYALLPTVSD